MELLIRIVFNYSSNKLIIKFIHSTLLLTLHV